MNFFHKNNSKCQRCHSRPPRLSHHKVVGQHSHIGDGYGARHVSGLLPVSPQLLASTIFSSRATTCGLDPVLLDLSCRYSVSDEPQLSSIQVRREERSARPKHRKSHGAAGVRFLLIVLSTSNRRGGPATFQTQDRWRRGFGGLPGRL